MNHEPLQGEYNMLTWYYDSHRSNVNDLLDVFNIFEDAKKNAASHKSMSTIDNEGIKIEMPGVKHTDLDVTLQGKTLKISAKSKHGKEHSYSYVLKSSVDESSITASLQDGLLEIKLPKKPESAVRKIEVK